jgi:hypothetical protein
MTYLEISIIMLLITGAFVMGYYFGRHKGFFDGRDAAYDSLRGCTIEKRN